MGVTQRAQGNVDQVAVEICQNIGEWMRVNGEGIYNSRPFEVFKSTEGDYYFTRKDGNIYVFVLNWPEEDGINIPELKTGGATIGSISEVELLGTTDKIKFEQNSENLKIELPNNAPNEIAATFKIHQDKKWINDDDPDVHYFGWEHKVNRNRGEFNNDVYQSTHKGERCSFEFEGIGINIISNTAFGLGKLLVIIDDNFDKVIELDRKDNCGVQQLVYSSPKLFNGKHKIEVVNAGNNLVMIDAFVVTKK